MSWVSSSVIWGLALICIAAGFTGIVFPALPGAPLIFVGMLLGAWANDFQLVGWPTLTLAGVLAIVTLIVDFIATAMGAKSVGASKAAIYGSALGTFAGIPFSIPGILFGPLIGAAVGELWSQRSNPDYWQISKVGLATWIGLLIGTVVKVAIACAMVGMFIVAALV